MDDLLFLRDGSVCVSDTAMQIPEFKEFKQYDRSTNHVFLDIAISYIFFVYKVFGDSKNMSYMSEMPHKQRQVLCCKKHTGKYSVEDFENNRWVRACIQAYLDYSRTESEKLLDAFKEDLDKYIEYVSQIPREIEVTAFVEVDVAGESVRSPVKVFKANIDERMQALKKAQDYKEMYSKWEKQTVKDNKIKQTQSRKFETVDSVKNLNLGTDFPTSKE